MGWKTKKLRVDLGHMKSSLKEIIISGTFTIKITGQTRKRKSIKMGSTRSLQDIFPPDREKVNRRNNDTLRRWKSSPNLKFDSEVDKNGDVFSEPVEKKEILADKDTVKTLRRRKNKRPAPQPPQPDVQNLIDLDYENRQCPPSPVSMSDPQESMSSEARGQDSRYTVVTSSSADDHGSASTLSDVQDFIHSDCEDQQEAISNDVDENTFRCDDNEPASPVSDSHADQVVPLDITDSVNRQTEYTPVSGTNHQGSTSDALIRNPHDTEKPYITCGSVHSDHDEHDLEPQAELSTICFNPEASVILHERRTDSDDSARGDIDKSDSSESHSGIDPVGDHLAIMPYDQSYSFHSTGRDEHFSQLCYQESTDENRFQIYDAISSQNQMAVNTTHKDKSVRKNISPRSKISDKNDKASPKKYRDDKIIVDQTLRKERYPENHSNDGAASKESKKGTNRATQTASTKTSPHSSPQDGAGNSQASKSSPSAKQFGQNTNSNWNLFSFGANATLSNVTIGNITIQSPPPTQNQTTGSSHPTTPDRNSEDLIYQHTQTENIVIRSNQHQQDQDTENDIQCKSKK